MFSESFMGDFFGLRCDPHPYLDLCGTFTQAIVDEAMALAKGQPAAANIVPYIQIVLDAKRLGLKVSK
jgi:hypothetical protein